MQVNFEKNLILNYIPYLVPNLRRALFAKEDIDAYFNAKFLTYPIALAYRTEEDDKSFRVRYQFDDDAAPGGVMTSGNYYTYKQGYSVKIFVEKRTEASYLRDAIRMRYQKNPYVNLLGYCEEYPKFPIGLWMTSLTVEDIRTSSSEIGAQRCVSFNFEVNLVISDVDIVPEILDVEYKVK